MSGTSDKMAGKAKQVIGKTTNNRSMEMRGKIQEAKGDLENRMKHGGERMADKFDNMNEPRQP